MKRFVSILTVIIWMSSLISTVHAENKHDGDTDLSAYPGEEWKSDYNDYMGDVVLKDAAAYSDSEMKNVIGTIPAYTAVTLVILF